MANINDESETELLTSKLEPKIAENESMSNVNGESSDAKGPEEKSEEQGSTQATIDTEKGAAPNLHPESDQSESLESELKETGTSNNKPPEEKTNAEKLAERLKNDYQLEFNAEGGLCDSMGKRFDFNFHATRHKNQERYDEIGNIVTEIIYDKMEKELGLQRVYIGEEKPDKKRSFFFASAAMLDEEQRKEKKLLIIIHGSGAVRAGQWARSIIINDERGLERGSQLPYIQKAQERERNFSVIVTNTNENYDHSDGWRSERYEHSGSPEEHAEYVWENYARHADRIAIVAHSYGGVVVARLAEKFHQDFDKKVFAIALTDSVHGGSMGTHAKRIFASRARNWVTSDEKLDTPLKPWTFCGWGNSEREDASRVSAGHVKHEWTSHACIESVFTYFDQRSHGSEERDDEDNNGDNNMDEGANCLGSSSAAAAAGDPLEPRSPAAAETCADSSNTNCAPLEQREAGDGAAAVPLEPNEPCTSDPANRRTDGEGEGQPRDSNDNGASHDSFVHLGP